MSGLASTFDQETKDDSSSARFLASRSLSSRNQAQKAGVFLYRETRLGVSMEKAQAKPFEYGDSSFKDRWVEGVDFGLLNRWAWGVVCRQRSGGDKFKEFARHAHNTPWVVSILADEYADIDEKRFNFYTSRPSLIAGCKVIQDLRDGSAIALRGQAKTGGKHIIETANDTIVGVQRPDGTWVHRNKLGVQLPTSPTLAEIYHAKLEIVEEIYNWVGGSGYRQGRVISGEASIIRPNGGSGLIRGCLGDFERFFKFTALPPEAIELYVFGYKEMRKIRRSGAIDLYQDIIKNPHIRMTPYQDDKLQNGWSVPELNQPNGALRWEAAVVQHFTSSESKTEDIRLALMGVPSQRLRLYQLLVNTWFSNGDCGAMGDGCEDVSPIVSEHLGIEDAGRWIRYRDQANNSALSLPLITEFASGSIC